MAMRRTKSQKNNSKTVPRTRGDEPTMNGTRKECHDLLNQAFDIATAKANNISWIIDWVGQCDELEEYGFTGDLKDEIWALKERLEAFPDELPTIENAMDQLKYEFFMANFAKIPLDALEWVVKTVNENKLPV